MKFFDKDLRYPREDIHGYQPREMVDHIAHLSLRLHETENELLRKHGMYVDMTTRAHENEAKASALENRLAIRDKEIDSYRELSSALQEQLRGKFHKDDDDRLRARRERDAARRAAKKS